MFLLPLWNTPAIAAERLVDHFPQAADSGCMKCHGEIELIRQADSPMMQQIMELGPSLNDPAGCVVCHGGVYLHSSKMPTLPSCCQRPPGTWRFSRHGLFVLPHSLRQRRPLRRSRRIDARSGQSKQGFDWVAAGRRHQQPEHAADRGESGYDTIIPGKISEQRSYLRWEEPMLGINGEGRVTPLAPGCQPSVTIIGEDGQPVLVNHIYRTEAGAEGGGDKGQLAIDMSPTQPHTTTKNARSCESCHASDKALGLGIGGTRPWNEQHFVDLETVDRQVLPKTAQPQMNAIENLDHDWSQIVDADGQQVATVGHHFQLSRAFNKEEMQHIRREGTCTACHQEIPQQSLAVSLLHHVAEYTGQIPKTSGQHDALVHKIVLSSAWGQVLAAAAGGLLASGITVWLYRRRRRRLS